jgi:hypothetical protein
MRHLIELDGGGRGSSLADRGPAFLCTQIWRKSSDRRFLRRASLSAIAETKVCVNCYEHPFMCARAFMIIRSTSTKLMHDICTVKVFS